MSGVLSAAVDVLGLFEGGLIDASFAGIDFTIINHREAPGRRALRFLFPGRDTPVFEDLGADTDPISITGFYAGEDYVDQAAALRAAVSQPGPYSFIHPWLGTLQVMLASKPTLSLSADELRVLRIELRLWIYSPPVTAPLDMLSLLLAALADIKQGVQQFMDTVLAVQGLISGAVGFVTGFVGMFAGAWRTLSLTLGSDASGALLSQAIIQLGGIGSVTPGPGYGAGVAALLAAPSAAMATAVSPPVAAAVAPGSVSATPVLADPRVVAAALIAAIPAVLAIPAAAAPGPALAAAAMGFICADLCAVVINIPFDSQQDAESWRDQALASLDTAATTASAQAALYPVAAGQMWRTLIAARAALSDELSVEIGQLPAVATLTLPAAANLWMVAQYLAGDDPTQVLGMYLDLRTRNDVINPAAVSGALETLVSP
jgi:hypothetical protein